MEAGAPRRRRSGQARRPIGRPNRRKDAHLRPGRASTTSRPSRRSAIWAKSCVILSRGRDLDQRPALVAGLDQQQAAGADLRVGRDADRPLDVLELDAAVGAVDDQRQPVAHAELVGDLAQLDHGADGRQVGRDGHEDPIRSVEDRPVERAVRRVQVDDHVVEVAAGDGDRAGDALRLEELGVERVRRERQDPQPGAVHRRLLGERQHRAAVHLVAPGVDDGRDRVHAQRRRDVPGHRVGVDQEDPLPACDQRRREVGGDHRLADAALRVEHERASGRGGPIRRCRWRPGGPGPCRRRSRSTGCTSPRPATGSTPACTGA